MAHEKGQDNIFQLVKITLLGKEPHGSSSRRLTKHKVIMQRMVAFVLLAII